MNTASVPVPTARPSRHGLNAALWSAQVLLAAMFGLAGILKSTTSIPELATTIAWTADVPVSLVRFIGAAELAGAIGMLVPSLLRIRPLLTPIAGLGLAIVMMLAAGFHVTRGEAALLGMPIALGGLAAFVAWGRLRAVPIEPRR